ncbi:MAG: ABC transporter permease [Gemmatimonadota bacterium]
MMDLARLWVRIVSVLVPGDRKGEWIEEWDGELASRGGSMRYAWGSLGDAWYLRTEGWTMDGMIRDVRLAVKGLIRRPFFTALAGVTLAIGIGANTAIFSVVDAVLLNALPYPESERLLSMNHTAPGMGVPLVPHSEGTYLFYSEGFHTLESFSVFTDDAVNLVTDGEPHRLRAARVTQPFFDVMATQPMLGRGFAEGEDRPGAEPVAILGYGLWQQSFGRDASVVGATVEMDGVQWRVVGVMPAGFQFPQETDLWTPLEIDDVDPELGSFGLLGVGRLAEGSSVAAAQAEMTNLLHQFAEANPEELPQSVLDQAGLVADVKPLKNLYVQDVVQALWVLMGTVGFVLLIACANVANLFLVRAEARQREQAVRTALGASRADMVRLYLAESLALALGGGLLGLVLASVGVQGLLRLAPVAVPRAAEIGIDGSVLVFTAIASVASGLLFGLFPVLGYGRRDLSGALKEGGRASTVGREKHRTRSALVVAQVGLALVLMIGSGLMARSFAALSAVDPGFESEDRLVFRVSLPSAEYPDVESATLFYRAVEERMAAIPGVTSVALTNAAPLVDTKSAGPMEPEDRPLPEGQLAPLVDRRQVGPGYFATLGIPMIEGRELTLEDSGEGTRTAVISRTLAELHWPGESPLGRRIRSQGSPDSGWEIVGVADDVHFETLIDEPAPLIYLPLVAGSAEEPGAARSLDVVLHVGSDPRGFVPAARAALREVDPRLPMVEPRPVTSLVHDAMASTSFTVVLLGIAAGIALLLGTVGIYGVISYVVSRRTSEIGVRMALGAPARLVLRDVVGQGMTLTGVGVAVGLLGAWGVSRALGSLLYGVSATDPLTYVATAAGLSLVALLASWLPARRAARVDPVEALRTE